MISDRPFQMAFIVAAAAFALIMRAGPAAAVPDKKPTAPAASIDAKKGKTNKAREKAGDKKKTDKSDKKSELQFRKGYGHAYDLIYRQHDYAAAIPTLRALGHDERPDVATLIGYASRKLGRYDEARVWYKKALAADPRHATTLSYMGMWHAEQGNRLKAQDYLENVRLICGTECRAFRELKDVIAHSGTY
jgi:tetratricopeptide (TPR) repeat protein